uniref:Secreted protein n=1 Tax=Salvator merianae TaxID=96440 RepID=A0A8D0BZZ8_SALMN
MLLASIAVEFGAVLPVLFPVLPLSVLPVGHVHNDQQGGAGDENKLEGPQPDVGDGEVVVKADIGASWLPVVAVKILLFVSPDSLGGHHVDQDPEDEDDRQPDPPKSSGVFVHPTQQALQCFPVHLKPHLT